MGGEQSPAWTRRGFLGAAGIGALTLAGCGGTAKVSASGTGSATSPTGQGRARRGGTFRLGTSDGSTSDSADPLFADVTYTNEWICEGLYDRLMVLDSHNFVDDKSLAEEVTAGKGALSWTVRLREAEFSNGKPVTADDVMFSIKRVLNPKAPGTGAGYLQAIDVNHMQKLDRRTVRLNLLRPDVALPSGFTDPGNQIVPVGFDPKNPVGSGPYKLKSITPGQQTVLVRNDNYWQSGKPYLDQVDIVDFADPNTTRINALQSDQIDAVTQVDFAQVPVMEGDSNLQVLISPAASYITWEMRMDQAPFDDVRVRQAMRLLANRPQIVDQAFSGGRFAIVGNDWPGIQDRNYDHSIPQRAQDIEQAKSLLKQAGRSDLSVTLTVAPGLTAGVVQTAQVLKQNAQAAGVNLNIQTIADSTTYFAKYAKQGSFKFSYYPAQTVFSGVQASMFPTSPFYWSAWLDPKWSKIMKEAFATLDAAKQKELLGEAQRIFWEIGSIAIFNFYHTVNAYNKTKFGGITNDPWGYGLNNLDLTSMYAL
jgi:peptide/nickel transport system substrate-binding protein